MNYRVHIVLALLCWMAGWAYVHGWMLSHEDWAICISQYDASGPIAPESDRPGQWSLARHLAFPFTGWHWLNYLGWGALAVAPAAIYAGVPRRVSPTALILIAGVAILPLIVQGFALEGWHDCDRKGSAYGSTALFIWLWQLAVIGLGSLIYAIAWRSRP